MKRFSRLCQKLESVPFTRSKAEILAQYLAETPEQDAGWTLFLLLGGQLPRVIGPAALEAWIQEESELPDWLWKECREHGTDLAETVALIAELSRDTASGASASSIPSPGSAPDDDLPLRAWIEERLQPLARASETERKAAIQRWWKSLSLDVSWAVHALAVGRFPVHVSRRIADQALEIVGGREAVLGLSSRIEALAAGQTRAAPAQLDLFSATPNR